MIKANVGQGAVNEPGQKRRAMIQGRVQRDCIILTNVRSFTRSLNQVIPNRVKIPMTVDGIVRRLVLNLDGVSSKRVCVG